MRNGGPLSLTLIGRGSRQRFSAALGQLGWRRRGGDEKGEGGQLVARREGWLINWRSSSGSFSIVGVMGQMSTALMALPDAWLAPCPRLWLQDEAVTQSRERPKEEKIKR